MSVLPRSLVPPVVVVVRGRPLVLAGIGWLLSLALAYGVGGALAAAGIVLSLLYTGTALATTALGTADPRAAGLGGLAPPPEARSLGRSGARGRLTAWSLRIHGYLPAS